jgi:hypothetical protein
MAILDTKIIKVEVPRSATNAAYAEYEYLLQWYSDQGTPVYYLFNDWTEKDSTKTAPINVKTDDIRSLIATNTIAIKLVAEDIARSDLNAFRSLKKSKNVARIMLDGTKERLAVLSGSITQRNSDQFYDIELQVQRREPDLIV